MPENGFLAPIYVARPVSNLCCLWALILHAFVGAVCIVLAFPWYAKLGLVCLLSVSFGVTIFTYAKSARELSSAQLRADDSWLLFTHRRQSLLAELVQAPFATLNLMLLVLRDQHGGLWMLSIAADNLAPDLRRRLYVRLKYPRA